MTVDNRSHATKFPVYFGVAGVCSNHPCFALLDTVPSQSFVLKSSRKRMVIIVCGTAKESFVRTPLPIRGEGLAPDLASPHRSVFFSACRSYAIIFHRRLWLDRRMLCLPARWSTPCCSDRIVGPVLRPARVAPCPTMDPTGLTLSA